MANNQNFKDPDHFISRTISIRSRVMPHQLSYDEDEENLKHELDEANQKLHETIEKMDKIKEERQLVTLAFRVLIKICL